MLGGNPIGCRDLQQNGTGRHLEPWGRELSRPGAFKLFKEGRRTNTAAQSSKTASFPCCLTFKFAHAKVLLYVLLSGSPPFDDEGLYDQILQAGVSQYKPAG